MEALFQSCQCLCRHTCQRLQPLEHTACCWFEKAGTDGAVFLYSWLGTGTVPVPHPPSPRPVWSQGPAGSAVVGGAHGYGVQTAAKSPREVPAAPAALPQHTE